MKLLYVVPRFPVPSETFVAHEVLEVIKRGHEVTVVAFSRPSPEQVERLGEELKALSRRTIYLEDRRWSPRKAAAWPRVLRSALRLTGNHPPRLAGLLLRAGQIADIAQKAGAELIFAHWPRPSEAALIAAEISGLPVAISVHAHEAAHDNAHFAQAFEQIGFAAFCNAAAMGYLLGKLPPAAADKARLLYHGVDFTRFDARPMPQAEGGLRIVTAGRLAPTKGFDRLIRGIALARTQGHDVRLTIAGDGSERVALAALAEGCGVADHIHFAGWVAHDDMVAQLASAHVFALLANDDFNDGLPNVVLEAMAVGRPAIVSPMPAAAEAITDGADGIILPRIDALDEFAEACAALIADRPRLEAMGQAAAASVRRKHDRAAQVDALCSAFAAAIATRGR